VCDGGVFWSNPDGSFFPNFASTCWSKPTATLPAADSYFYWEKVDSA
jgi:hypothetical protein